MFSDAQLGLLTTLWNLAVYNVYKNPSRCDKQAQILSEFICDTRPRHDYGDGEL